MCQGRRMGSSSWKVYAGARVVRWGRAGCAGAFPLRSHRRRQLPLNVTYARDESDDKLDDGTVGEKINKLKEVVCTACR